MQDNTITSSMSTPVVRNLKITKKCTSETEIYQWRQRVDELDRVPILAHFCDNTSQIMSSAVNTDLGIDFSREVSTNQIESIVAPYLNGGLYFLISGMRPSRGASRDMTVNYPLLAWHVKRNTTSRNINMDQGTHMKWFTAFEPHALQLFGSGAEFIFGTILNEIQTSNSFDFGGHFLSTIQRDAVTRETIAQFESIVTYLPIGKVDIPIFYQLATDNPNCDGISCKSLPRKSSIFQKGNWSSTY